MTAGIIDPAVRAAAEELLDEIEAAEPPPAFAIIMTDPAADTVTVYGPYAEPAEQVQERRDAMLADVNRGIEDEPAGSRWAQPWTAIVAPIYPDEPTAAEPSQ